VSDEEYVRSKWERVWWTSSDTGPIDGTRLHVGGQEFFERNSVGNVELYMIPGLEARLWQAAAEFTSQREEEIRLVEEEIAWISDGMAVIEYMPIAQRILTRLQEILADKKRGLKERQ